MGRIQHTPSSKGTNHRDRPAQNVERCGKCRMWVRPTGLPGGGRDIVWGWRGVDAVKEKARGL